MPDYNFLEELWLRKAKNSKTGLLIKEDEKPRITKIFRVKESGISAFLGCDHPQILALYSKKLKKFHLYNMSEQVTPLIRTHFISFTKRASNIQIGDYVFIQRQGGVKKIKLILFMFKFIFIKKWGLKNFLRGCSFFFVINSINPKTNQNPEKNHKSAPP